METVLEIRAGQTTQPGRWCTGEGLLRSAQESTRTTRRKLINWYSDKPARIEEDSDSGANVVLPAVVLGDGSVVEPMDSSAMHPLERHPRKSYYLDEDESAEEYVYVVNHEYLGIHVVADTQADLARLLEEEIRDLWINYAMEEDTALTSDARELKNRLRSSFRQVGANA